MKISGKGCLWIAVGAAFVAIVPIALVLFLMFFIKPTPRSFTPAEMEFDSAYAALGPELQIWQPDPAQLTQLEPVIELHTVIREMLKRKAEKSGLAGLERAAELEVGNYALRLPPGFRLQDEFCRAQRPTNLNWQSPNHTDGTSAAIMVSIQPLGADQLPDTAELLRRRIPVTGGSQASRQLMELQSGKIGELSWVRGRWSYSDANSRIKGELLRYGAVNERRRETILIEAQDCLPFAKTTLEQLDTAIRTFQEK